MNPQASTPPVREEWNWAGNVRYRAAEIVEPTTISEAQQAVARATRVRPLGTRHPSNGLPNLPSGVIQRFHIRHRDKIDVLSGYPHQAHHPRTHQRHGHASGDARPPQSTGRPEEDSDRPATFATGSSCPPP